MKILVSTFLFILTFTLSANAQNGGATDLSDTATLLDLQQFKAERTIGFYLTRNEGNGTTLFTGRIHPLMLVFWKRGVWFYAKRAGVDPVQLMNLKSIEKYKGKRPRLRNFVFIGSEVFAVAEYRRKGSKYVMLQELNINTGRLVDKPKVIIRQKVRGLKYANKFEYDFYPTPDGTKVGLIYEQTRKTTQDKGDKKYILIDEELEKVGRRTLKRNTKSAFNKKEKVSNKNTTGYNILNDGTLYTDVSENFREAKELTLDGPSLLIYPIDTNYVVNVKLDDEVSDNKESQVGSLSWWHSDTSYSALGIKYTVEETNKKKKTLSQSLVITNSLNLDKKETVWQNLDYPVSGIDEAINLNTYVIDGQRVAIINHYSTEKVVTVDANGNTSTSTRYRLKNTNVLGLEDDGDIAWQHPIALEYPQTTYNHHKNPYVLFRKGDQLYFVNHERDYWSIIPIRSFYEIYRIKLKTGEVKYEKKKVPFRIPTITNENNGLNEHSISAHRRRFMQLFHGKKVYEFSVR